MPNDQTPDTDVDTDDTAALEAQEAALAQTIADRKAAKAAKAAAKAEPAPIPSGDKGVNLNKLFGRAPTATNDTATTNEVATTDAAADRPLAALVEAEAAIPEPVVPTVPVEPVAEPAPVVAPEPVVEAVPASDDVKVHASLNEAVSAPVVTEPAKEEPRSEGPHWYATGKRTHMGIRHSPAYGPGVDVYHHEFVLLLAIPTDEEHAGATTPEAVAALIEKYGVKHSSYAEHPPK